MSGAPPALRVDPADEARLAEQARRLALAEATGAEALQTFDVVTFTLGGHRCAVGAGAVARAVTRLGITTEVPARGGGSTAVAWVDEQPVAVVDLASLAGLEARPAAALARVPALLVATPAGLVAVAVGGPLELAEGCLALAAGPALAGLPGLALAGRLAGGEALVAGPWLAACASRVTAP